jgi:putative transcriptional regulator
MKPEGNLIKFNLKELLIRKGFAEKRTIPLQEVASVTGIGISTLSRIANSKGDYHTTTLQLEKLCRYFKCTPNDFMTIIPDPEAATDTPE